MKLQITITDQEEKLLAQKASQLGYDVTKYIKFLITNEAINLVEIPVFQMSKKLERITRKALEDDKAGKTKLWEFGKYGN